jgi:D-lyxose ketol-isomerase
MTHEKYIHARNEAVEYLTRAGIVLTEHEKDAVEVTDYGLGMLDTIGLQLAVYLNTERCCAKELILFPVQTCPEHRHPPVDGKKGKEETFRCRWGRVYLYIPGSFTLNPYAALPPAKAHYFTVWHEIVLDPGEQFTLQPDTLHWFQAGPEGAIVSEFSTKSRDNFDIYTDPHIDPAHKRKV